MLRVAAAAGKVQFADHEISQVKSSQRLWLPGTVRNVAAYANKTSSNYKEMLDRREAKKVKRGGRDRFGEAALEVLRRLQLPPGECK